MTMKTNYWFNRNRLLSDLRFITALLARPISPSFHLSEFVRRPTPAQTYSGRLNERTVLLLRAHRFRDTQSLAASGTVSRQYQHTGSGHTQRLLRRQASSGLWLQCLDAGDLIPAAFTSSPDLATAPGGAPILIRRPRRSPGTSTSVAAVPQVIRTTPSRIWA